MTSRTTIFLCSLLLLAACGKSETTNSEPPKLFAEQRDALEQAKAVEAAQKEVFEKQQKEIEKQAQ